MSKPAIFLVLGAAAIVLAIGLGVLAPVDKREKRTVAAPSETEESTAEPSPPVPKEAVRESPPRLPTPVPIAARRPKREEPPAPERLDEPSLIARLHDLAASDPPQSLKLAREALERFRDSPHAPEFEWNVVKALANMGRYDEAEEEARVMLEKYPDNPLSIDVEHHLLKHPPNPPGTP